MFAIFLFSASFSTLKNPKKLAPFPVTSHQLYFRLTCSLPCSSGVTVDFVHTELPGGSAFCSALTQRSDLMSFLAPLSHSLLKVLLKDVDRRTRTLTGRYKWEGKNYGSRSAKSKGKMVDKTVSQHQRAAILLTPNQATKKTICSYKWESQKSGRCHFLVKNGNHHACRIELLLARHSCQFLFFQQRLL